MKIKIKKQNTTLKKREGSLLRKNKACDLGTNGEVLNRVAMSGN